MFAMLAVRDALILAAVAGLWVWAAEASSGAGMLADLVGLLLGLGVGVCVFLLHEWGHLLGAFATRSVVRAPGSLRGAYLFSYDSKRNSRPQFLVMSFAGFAVTGAALWFGYRVLPDPLLATRVARGAIVALASLTVFIEFPIVIVSLLRPKALPPVEVFAEHREAQKAA